MSAMTTSDLKSYIGVAEDVYYEVIMRKATD